jgi:acetamidase/formamidase
VYVEAREPGDALEVKVLSIDLPIDYGYNGCSGFMSRETATGRQVENHAPSIAEVDDRPSSSLAS